MRALTGLVVAACGMIATPALAQSVPPPSNSPTAAGALVQNPTVRNGGDTTDRDIERARDDAMARENKPHGNHAVPAKPDDIVAGAAIRDSKGAALGTVESVTMSGAVVATANGKVMVPLDAFGKDGKGLVFGMTKADFDAQVAAANQPQ
jgi:hypothetical protein